MNSTIRTVLGVIGTLVLIALGLWFLWVVRTIIVYVLVAIAISLIGRPIAERLEKIRFGKFRIPSGVSALLTLLTFLGILVGFVSLFIPLVNDEIQIVSKISPQEVAETLEEPLAKVESYIVQYNLADEGESPDEYIMRQMQELFHYTKVSAIFGGLIGALGNIFVALFSIFFISFFFLKERDLPFQIVEVITPDKHVERVRKVLNSAKNVLSRYLIGLLIQMSMITLLVFLGLSLVGVENALVLGFFAGVVNIIPYIGPWIGAGFGVIIGLSTHLDLDFYTEMLPFAGSILVVFLTIQLLDNFILQPFIFSNSVAIHPLEVFLVVLIAGSLAGVTGMILAIPAYSFIRILAAEFLSEYKIVREMTKNVDQSGDS